MWLLIPKELSGSGRFQGGGGLIILKQRLCAQHVKQHLGVRSMTLAAWAVSLDFLYDYYVLLCPGFVGTRVWGGLMPSCCCDCVSNEQLTSMFTVSSHQPCAKKRKEYRRAECGGNWCRVNSSPNLCIRVCACTVWVPIAVGMDVGL